MLKRQSTSSADAMIVNLPNILTGLRLLLAPVIVVLVLSHDLIWQMLGTLFFIIAALTDHLDGRLARKFNLVTAFGKFADPLADKLLTLSAFVTIVLREEFAGVATYLAVWVAIIAVREIGITVLRIWAVKQETPLITSMWGKAKTTTQLFTIIITLVLLNFRHFSRVVPESAAYYPGDKFLISIVHILFIICMLVTVVSGIIYITGSRYETRNST
ncbi:MAG: CDP-diacylglycerol--glycerol-3-phosphate 3-phosphatidyltransferase [bacterium]|nr:CDP-diacylglycerol--glycerol-3-phosphate 3-phosphatidyltransferase [bacterium]